MTPLDTGNPSATQPAAATILQADASRINPAIMQRLAATLMGRFQQYESDRRLAELKWERNARQYLGVYDPDVDRSIDMNRSRAYPKLTRVKCVSMLSRMMNLLFQAGDKNWTINPTPVPNLDEKDLQTVLTAVMQANPQPSDQVIEQAIRDFAKAGARNMELLVEDQLQELGGSRKLNYVALCRKVLASGIQYGCGVIKGPFVEQVTLRKWAKDATGNMVSQPYVAYRPRFDFVSLWDYYPDMAARSVSQMDGQFERMVMSRHQVNQLKLRPDFMRDQINAAMRENPNGNHVRRSHETELRAMGVAVNVSQPTSGKFEVIVWEGFVSGEELRASGANVPDNQLQEDVRASVWMLGGHVIKAEMDPWASLAPGVDMPRYHHFIFEEDESFLLGNGLPSIMRDSQMGVCAATRMALDNGAVQRVFEVNMNLLSPNQDIQSIQPDMVIQRDDDNPATMQYPAVRAIDIPVHLAELQGMVNMFQSFADQETFVGAATGGDIQKGPSEPFRTATGASMLRGDAALPFKDVVRNFDMFTESMIGTMVTFNQKLNSQDVRGDYQAVARGATSLIAKEVLGLQLDNLAQTLTDEEKKYVDMKQLVRERLRVRDMDVTGIVYDDAKCKEIDAANAAAQQQQTEQQQQMATAQIREILAGALKDISQAGKNTANAEAASAQVILGALDKGINPDVAAPAKETADGPEGTPQDGAGLGEPITAPGAGGGLVGPTTALQATAGGAGSQVAGMPAR